MKILKKINKIIDTYKYFGLYSVMKSFCSYLINYRIPAVNCSIDHNSIKIFIISYNRLECLKKLILFLESRGLLKNTIIIDNNSTYAPLLDYLGTVHCRVVYLKDNLGHLALWNSHLFDEIIYKEPFILTDCDVLPDSDVPNDFIEQMLKKLQKNQGLTKIGLSLLLEDIPDSNLKKEEILNWERKFWSKKLVADETLFDAIVDTTFAIYRPCIPPYLKQWYFAARMDKPFVARHLGWYVDTNNPTLEECYYINNLKYGSSHWFSKNMIKRN